MVNRRTVRQWALGPLAVLVWLSPFLLRQADSRVPRLTPKTGRIEKGRFQVDQVIIVGNESTPQCFILMQLRFRNGSWVGHRDLRAAEANLAGCGLFEVDRQHGFRPRVEVLEPDRPGELRDVLVDIRERPGSILFWVACDLLFRPLKISEEEVEMSFGLYHTIGMAVPLIEAIEEAVEPVVRLAGSVIEDQLIALFVDQHP